ncbi:hypothetical protein E2320_006788 [Naja naja]|nr:hypothetical protein E2320_006788 [Naja naja]
MASAAAELALLAFVEQQLKQFDYCSSVLLTVCHALENTTAALRGPPMAAAVRSHFNNCPDAHSTFCFHGTCRFLVQEEEPTCVCHSGYMGARCELADLLAVVADTQKKQTITALVVVSIVASIVVIMVCVLIHHSCSWPKLLRPINPPLCVFLQLLQDTEALRVVQDDGLQAGETPRAAEGGHILLPLRDSCLTKTRPPDGNSAEFYLRGLQYSEKNFNMDKMVPRDLPESQSGAIFDAFSGPSTRTLLKEPPGQCSF